jgi:Putative transposase, YhgA-like
MEKLTPENFDDFINNIFDKIFKLFFTHKQVAVDCLTHFVDKKIVDKLDLDQMTLKDTNFISKNLAEYYSDVIYETTLKEPLDVLPQKNEKQKARVILVWEHKKGIISYFNLFVQLLIYKTKQYEEDIKEKREPTLVIPIIVNQSLTPLKKKNFHDSFKHIPEDLLIFVEKFECYVINVQKIKRTILLKMEEEGLLRGLFLAYQVVEHPDEKDDILLEVFKFLKNENYLTHFFQPLLAFIMKTGNFEQPQVKQMIDNYLTPQQKQEPVTVRLSTLDRWEAQGIAIGEARGEQKKAHLVLLRGLFMGVKIDLLMALAQVTEEDALVLAKGYDAVKKAWKKKKTDIPALAQLTKLSEAEVQYIISCLDSTLTTN